MIERSFCVHTKIRANHGISRGQIFASCINIYGVPYAVWYPYSDHVIFFSLCQQNNSIRSILNEVVPVQCKCRTLCPCIYKRFCLLHYNGIWHHKQYYMLIFRCCRCCCCWHCVRVVLLGVYFAVLFIFYFVSSGELYVATYCVSTYVSPFISVLRA